MYVKLCGQSLYPRYVAMETRVLTRSGSKPNAVFSSNDSIDKKNNAIGPLVAEIFMFESVNILTHGRTDTRMTARWVYYKLIL